MAQSEFTRRLTKWHEANGADFPWRNTSDPYTIIVTEMLLRKTTRHQVAKLFPLFFKLFPNLKSLKEGRKSDLQNLLRPLGMWRKRAQLIKNFAQAAMEQGGKIPSEKEKLLELPGVGLYSANAVRCFAFGSDEPLVDTNMIRVLKRVFSIRSSKKREREDESMWKLAHSLIPKGRAKELNLSILDFADSICRFRDPKCSICPLSSICDYYKNTVKGAPTSAK